MITVQADSCMNSEQIDTLFTSVGDQEKGFWGGGSFWAGGPKNAHDCQEIVFAAHMVFLAGKSPYLWSYTVQIYGSGQPYTYPHTYPHTYTHTYTHTYLHTYLHTYTRTGADRRGGTGTSSCLQPGAGADHSAAGTRTHCLHTRRGEDGRGMRTRTQCAGSVL